MIVAIRDAVCRRDARDKHKPRGCRPTYFHIFETVLCTDDPEHILLTALLHLASDQQLVKYEVGLLEVEDDVQLADVAVVFVHLLYIAVYNLEGDELIVGGIGGGDEEQRCISTVHDFGVCRQSGREVEVDS